MSVSVLIYQKSPCASTVPIDILIRHIAQKDAYQDGIAVGKRLCSFDILNRHCISVNRNRVNLRRPSYKKMLTRFFVSGIVCKDKEVVEMKVSATIFLFFDKGVNAFFLRALGSFSF